MMRSPGMNPRASSFFGLVALGVSALAATLWVASHVAGVRAFRVGVSPGAARFVVLADGGLFLVTQRADVADDGA